MDLKFKTSKSTVKIAVITALISFSFNRMDAYAQNNNNNNEKINIGLIYPLSSNWKTAAADTNKFSLNLIAGVSAAEHGVSLAGVTNIIRNDAWGLQIAGFSNHIDKKADGVMLAGFMNTYGSGRGLAVAGFGNFSKTGGGVQIAGFMNKAGTASGIQVAGFANIASEIRGSQVSGFMNIAKKVRGLQLAGFINIADSADYQIGLINIAKNGERSIGASIDENQTTLLTFRSGGKRFYGILGVGYNFKNKKQIYAWEAGLGAHLINAGVFRLNTELTQSSLESFKGGNYLKSAFSVLPALRIAHMLEIFAGPSFNYVNTDTAEGSNLRKKYTSSWGGNNGNSLQGLYFGYSAGIQLYL